MPASQRGSVFRRAAARWLCVALALGMAACSRPARPVPPALTTECYVWQQSGGPAVEAAVARARETMEGYYLHAAEVKFGPEAVPVTKRFAAPWAAAAATGRRVGLVIRIPVAEGGLGSDARQARAIAELVSELKAEGAKAGAHLETAEVQIDYDCPDSKLALFAVFLTALRAQGVGPLVFTALPSWLNQPAFPKLAQAADSYVLQVHSLELPRAGETEIDLCDPEKARQALRRAAEIGAPFRLALPTYRSVVLEDAGGKVFGVVSEGEAPEESPGIRRVPGRSRAPELARLVGELRPAPPAGLRGIIWYRLPVEGDRMNWTWPTLQLVAAGHEPISRLAVRAVPDPKGFSTVQPVNTGETSEPLPSTLQVLWASDGRPAAADALGAYREENPPRDGHWRLVLKGVPLHELAPGQKVTAGWIRVGNPGSLTAEIIP